MVNFDHVTVINYGYGIKRHILDIFIHEVHNFYNSPNINIRFYKYR